MNKDRNSNTDIIRGNDDIRTEGKIVMAGKITWDAPSSEKAAAVICGLLIILAALITATQALCFWLPGWWVNEYSKYDTPSAVNGEMSLEDAVYVTEQMLDYCIGRLDTLDDTMAAIDGIKVPFFTDREKSHLYDCRVLFQRAMQLRIAAILLLTSLLFRIWFSVRRRKEVEYGEDISLRDAAAAAPAVRADFIRSICTGYLCSLAASLVAAALIAAAGARNFTKLFTEFHHLFFSNELWLLDPHRDNLINIMQEQVFRDAAVCIAEIWTASLLAAAGLCILILRKKSR